MTSPAVPSPSLPAPPLTATTLAAQHPDLWQPLQRLARRRRRLELARAFCYWLALGLGGLLTLVILRWSFPRLPQALAIGLWILYWVILVAVALMWMRPTGRVKARAAGGDGRQVGAGLGGTIDQVERAAPEVEERFSSAVELLAEPDERFRGSPELVACLVRQAQGAVEKLDPEVVLPFRRVRRGALLLLALVGLWLLLALARPEALASALGQSLRPWSNGHQPVAGEDFPWQIDPGSCQIAQADPLTITAEYRPPQRSSERNRTKPDADETTPSPIAPGRGLTLRAHYPNGQTLTYPMMRTGTASFQYTFDHVAQGFVYQLRINPADSAQPNAEGASVRENGGGNANAGDSALFTVTVLPRPELRQLTVHYEYPLYTRLGRAGKRTDDHGDGDIEAPVGTRVTILATTSLPVAPTSHLLLNPDSTGPMKLLLSPSAPVAPTPPGGGEAGGATPPAAQDQATGRHVAVASLLLDKPGEYTYRPVLFCRVGQRDVPSLPQRTRAIRVKADAPPQIKIGAPGSTLRVRATETVPVRYAVTDDFGLTRLQARYQIDQTAPEIMELPLGPDQPTLAEGVWSLAIPELLARKNLASARQITYQLKATDNAPATGPPPALPGQDTLSSVYTLDLDTDARPLDPELAATQPAKMPTAQELAAAAQKLQEQQRQLQAAANPPATQADHTGKAPGQEPGASATQLGSTTAPKKSPPEQTTEPSGPSNASTMPREDPATRQTREIQDLKRQVEQLGQDIAKAKQEQHPPVRPGDPENQKARDLAQQVARQARSMPKTDPAKKSAAQEALKDAQAAKEAAESGQAEEAQRRLSSATSKMEQAAPKPAEKNGNPSETSQAKSNPPPAPNGADKQPEASKTPPTQTPGGQQNTKPGANSPKESEGSPQTAAGQKPQPGEGQPEPGKEGEPKTSSGTGTPGENNGGQNTATEQSTAAQDQQRLAQELRQTAREADQAARESQQNGDPATAQKLSQAARQMREAAESQERSAQAAKQGDREGAQQAARESAQQLAQGTQSLQQAAQSAPEAPPAAGGKTPGTTTGSAPGGGGSVGKTNEGKVAKPMPEPVQELGISPGDWARLTPDLQQQLLNAARQPGPPEYQELIKHYFERIARLESPRPAAPVNTAPPTPARGNGVAP